MLVRHLGSNILDILYPPRVTRERYRAVIGRLNGRIRDLRSETLRLEAIVARLQGSGPDRPRHRIGNGYGTVERQWSNGRRDIN